MIDVSGRWVAWARERAGRAGRAHRRHRPVRMTLLRPVATVGAPVREIRTSVSSVHLHLAVHLTRERLPGGPGRGRTGVPVRPVPRVVVPRWPAQAHRGGAGGRAAEPVAAPTVGQTRRTDPVRVLRVLPARRAARDDGTRVARGGPDHARRHRDELVTRLVRSGRRVEVPARPTPVVQHRTVVGDLGRRSTDVAPERRAGAAAPWGGSATGPVTTSGTAAAVDLDRLTDQVVSRLDSRLTAHRERFGRAF